jgi:Ca2+-binding RTX toxin-like protein
VDSIGSHTINVSSTSENIVYGLNGDDLIIGGSLNDNLAGGQQNDTLKGLGGSDQLWGGPNSDTFVFVSVNDSNGTTSIDTILDFSGQEGDKIDLSQIDSNTAVEGNQAFAFVTNSTSAVVANSVSWYQTGGNTIVQGDVNGDTTADLHIVLSGLHTLSSTNFML